MVAGLDPHWTVRALGVHESEGRHPHAFPLQTPVCILRRTRGRHLYCPKKVNLVQWSYLTYSLNFHFFQLSSKRLWSAFPTNPGFSQGSYSAFGGFVSFLSLYLDSRTTPHLWFCSLVMTLTYSKQLDRSSCRMFPIPYLLDCVLTVKFTLNIFWQELCTGEQVMHVLTTPHQEAPRVCFSHNQRLAVV